MIGKPKRHKPGDVAISSIALAELQFGVSKSKQFERNRTALDQFLIPLEVLPFDEAAADVYGHIRATLEIKGASIGPLDTLIASHALAVKAAVVTNNTREFSRVEGLRVENWIND